MELKHYSIIEYNILRRAECTFPQENILRMTVEDNAVFREKTSELKRILEKVFHERCGLPVDVIYEYIPVKENQESQQREAQIQREINDRLVALADKLGDGADAAAPVKKEEMAHSARTAGAGNGGNGSTSGQDRIRRCRSRSIGGVWRQWRRRVEEAIFQRPEIRRQLSEKKRQPRCAVWP